jgi:hypothetical protein
MPGGAVGMPRKVLVTSLPSRRPWTVLGGGEDLGQVDGAHAGAQAAQPAADVHQAGAVAGAAQLGVGGQHVAHLVGEHGGGDVGVLHREGAAEPAARLRLWQLHQVDPAHLAEQAQRPVADPQQPQGVAGRVVGHPVREVGADVGDPEHVDQELRQFVGARRQVGGGGRQALVAGLLGHPGVLVADGPGAGAARHHHRVVAGEAGDVPADQGKRLTGVAGVDVRLPAAGLRERHLDALAEPLQQPDGGLADLREHPVDQAGHEQGEAHGQPTAVAGW